MNKIASFIFGSAVGIAGTLYVVLGVSSEQQIVNAVNSESAEIGFSQHNQLQQIACDKPHLLETMAQSEDSSELDSLLNAFASRTEDIFENQDYKDLSYLIRKDKKVAEQVRKRFLESKSYEEKHALMNLLSQDNSDETINMVIGMIQAADDESKRLGFELLGSMELKESHMGLNQALLDATYDESNPELLTDVIYRLAEKKLDDSTKIIAIERLQTLLANDNSLIKARAIEGLSQLGDQTIISTMIRQHLQDPDEAVRVSAISAAFKLSSIQMDQEITSALTNMASNPNEPESVRNMASAVLGSQKSAL